MMANRARARIVALDDDTGMLALLQHALHDDEHSLSVYQDPGEGLQKILEQPPELVITDLSMPGGSGLEVIKQLREHYTNDELPIIVLSATGDEDVILQCFGAGATDYLVKPFGEGELKAKVKILLRRAREMRDSSKSRRLPSVFDDENWTTSDIVGRVFAGYRIEKKIGEGGMGVVYRAQDTATDEVVALKVLSPVYARDQAFLKRFVREANYLKEVDHKNIARFYELGQVRNTYYIAMEFVDGPSLEEIMRTQDLLSEVRIVDIIIQVAEALNALHKQGIVHRDIKPGNVLVEADGTCKLVDFGLTKRPTDERLTEQNLFFGTAAYMSPEQARGSATVDIRSDLYALGVLFYYLATGELPFDGDDTYAILFKQVHEDPPEPQSRNPLLTDTANFMILKMLSKDPKKRFQTPAELLRALRKHREFFVARSGQYPGTTTEGVGMSTGG